jgi:hypothetical protein
LLGKALPLPFIQYLLHSNWRQYNSIQLAEYAAP